MIKYLLFPVLVSKMLYRFFTRKAYYLTGTTVKDGKRIFFKVTFCTYGDTLPIASIEKELAEEMEVDKCIILFFNRISYSMVKYMDKEVEGIKIIKEEI